MTRAEDLLQALNGLQRAADSELSGDAREAASQYIKELFRFAGFDGEDAGEGRGEEAVPFAQALAEVRTQAEGELSGNAFELASIIFDDLASLSPSPASAPQEHAPEPATEPAPQCSEPVSETPVESARAGAAQRAASFNEVGAASKARVEEVAASLGIGISRPSSPRPRSPGAAAVVGVIEAASAREVAEATHDFGIPAAAGGDVPEYAEPHADPAPQGVAPVEFKPKPAVAAGPRVIVTKAEPRSASTARAATPLRPAKTTETTPKPQHNEPDRAFFNLWFDMMFGRKR
jgi:hypothetical protein